MLYKFSVTLFAFLLFISLCHAETKSELYQRIFGHSVTTSKAYSIPFNIDNKQFDEIKILPFNKGEYSVDKKQLFNALKTVLSDSYFNSISNATHDQKNISLSWLNQHEIKADYDQVKQRLFISTPLLHRKVSQINLSPKISNNLNSQSYKPANLSAYVNMGFDSQRYNQVNESKVNTLISLQKVINYKGWVIESSSVHNSDNFKEQQPGDTTITKDYSAKNMRFTVGDIILPSLSFQNTFLAQGIKINKFQSLSPNIENVQPIKTDFVLQYDSVINIYANDEYYKSINLSAGKYDIRDFPVANGINDIKIIIESPFTKTRIIELSFFSGANLVSKDSSEYGIGIGYPDLLTQTIKKSDKLVTTGFYRKGISSYYTSGINFQEYNGDQLLGNENHFINSYGSFTLDPAVSINKNNTKGFALTMGYSSQYRKSKSKNIWTWSLTKYNKDFQTPTISTYNPQYSAAVSGSLFVPLDSSSLSIRMNLQELLTSKKLSKRLGIYYSKRENNKFSWRLSLLSTELPFQNKRTFLQAQINYRFGNKNTVSSRYETYNDDVSTTWRKESIADKNINAEIEYKRHKAYENLRGDLDYRGTRLNTKISHNQSMSNKKISQSRIQVNSALVYADGYFSLTKPVSNNFAIIVPHESLAEHKVTVNPIKNTFAAESDFFGKAVISGLAPYSGLNLNVDIPDLPLGYLMGNDRPYLMPTYKSGTLITLGSHANVYLRATLTNDKNHPLSYVSGELVAANKEDKTSILFFTNKEGHFQAAGLKPGKYIVKLISNNKKSLMVEIPSNIKGMYDAGTLTFK